MASGGLGLTGVATLRHAPKRYRLLALVPLLFAIQQAIEGVQWLFLNQGKTSMLAAYAFLFFAFILWPVYVPYVLYRVDRVQRSVLRWFVYGGALVSATYLYSLFTYPLAVFPVSHSCVYDFGVPFGGVVIGFLYFIVVFGALIVSSEWMLRLLGVLLAVAAVAAYVSYHYAFASVWCFFAALLSGLLYIFIRRVSLRVH